MNWIDGVEPDDVVQLPRFKLLVSPVVPALDRQLGAEVLPLLTAAFTVIEEPVLNLASDPPALPTTLNSDSFHTVAK